MSTNIFQCLGTDIASRGLRAADISAKVDEAVAGVGLVFARDRFGQYSLDANGILKLFGIKTESAAYSDTVSVGNDAGNAEDVAEEKVGDLSSDAGEFAELFDVARQFSAVFVEKLDASRLDRRRLCAVKSARTDYIFDILEGRIGKRGKRRIFFKQVFANNIDSRIGALGGKSAHYHQPPSLAASPIKGASGIRIEFLECGCNERAALGIGFLCFFFHFHSIDSFLSVTGFDFEV